MIDRRAFVATMGTGLAWPAAVRAQASAVPVVGFLSSGSPGPFAPFVTAFRQGLAEAGYVEGRNVAIEFRWAEGRYERLPALAAELVQRQVAVVVASGGSPSALAAKGATQTIPVAFIAADPVHLQLVESLGRPGGNATGINALTTELAPKRLEVLRVLKPEAKTVAVLVNPTNPTAERQLGDVRTAAEVLGLALHVLTAGSEAELEPAFVRMGGLRPDALLVLADPFYMSHRVRLAALSLRAGLPSIYDLREFAATGGLMSYGTSLMGAYRQVGAYAGRILGGAKPADLPILQADVELVINLGTAKALGITVPPALLLRADEVIE